MRAPFGAILLLTMLLGGTYWYTKAAAVCPVPLEYRLGELDGGFGLSENEARVAIADAEAVWENATGRNLFSYQEDGDYVVNFIYDERQERADEEGELKLILDVKENINEELKNTYERLVSTYNTLAAKYKSARDTHEAKLNAYNAEVDKYNQAGGAPPGVYEKLEEQRLVLKDEEEELKAQVQQLNSYADQINQLGERSNQYIDDYNQEVEHYNEEFANGSEEFTQGDYQHKDINIYTFKDRTELVTVLAHELGHALSLEHVDNPQSVMYYLMGKQPQDLTLSAEDLNEFSSVCGTEDNFLTRFKRFLSGLY